MTIVVCVKHVPDLQSDRGLTDAGRMVRDPDDSTLNELDEHAIEAALVVAAATGEQVMAVTVGPGPAAAAVRRAVQMGAHQAVHVVDDAITGSDVLGTARVLAAAVHRIGDSDAGPVSLVLTGMAALDGLTSMVPTAVAVELGLPALTLAARLTVTSGVAEVVRDLGDAREVLQAALPAVVSVTDQSNQPRYPSSQGILAARAAQVTTWSLADLGLSAAQVGVAGARTEVRAAQPHPPRPEAVLITDDGDGGTRLAEFLIENKLV